MQEIAALYTESIQKHGTLLNKCVRFIECTKITIERWIKRLKFEPLTNQLACY